MGDDPIIEQRYSIHTDDPHVRFHLKRLMDQQMGIPIRVSKTYPKRGTDIMMKVRVMVGEKGPNEVMEYDSPLEDQTFLPEMQLVVCSWGNDLYRIRATKSAFDRIIRMNPLPEIMFVEGSTDGKFYFEYVKEYKHVNYLPVDLTAPMFHNLFMKEILWNYGVSYILEIAPETKKICYLDADCSFVDMYSFKVISDALDNYEVISPFQITYYETRKEDDINYGIMHSTGYQFTLQNGLPGWFGFGVAMTTEALKKYFNNELPCSCAGLGDIFLWYMLAGYRNLRNYHAIPFYKHILQNYRIKDAKVGFAPTVLVHHYHGKMSQRQYTAKYHILRRCVPQPFGELARVGNSSLMCWNDKPEVQRYRYFIDNLAYFKNKGLRRLSVQEATEFFEWLMKRRNEPPTVIKQLLPVRPL